MIRWNDVIKLTVPFIFSLALIWISDWYDRDTQKQYMQSALSQILRDEILSLDKAVDQLRDFSNATREGELGLASSDVPAVPRDLASSLSSLDTSNSYYYSDFISTSAVLMSGYQRLSELSVERIKAPTTEIAGRVERAFRGQCKALASDLLIYGRSAMVVIGKFPDKYGRVDGEELKNLQTNIEMVQKKVNEFPPSL